MKRNSEINAEIFNYGAALFDYVRNAVIKHATWGSEPGTHALNREKLQRQIAGLMEKTAPRLDLLNQDQLWQLLWQRIVYAGTKASKATAEISSMSKLVPLFQSLDEYEEGRFVFDEEEWKQFKDSWRDQAKNNWLRYAKSSNTWNPQAHFMRTTPEVWKILTKDDLAYPELKFSALPQKVKKYLNVARTLRKRRDDGVSQALQPYLRGASFSTEHLAGQAWVEERAALAKVRDRLGVEVGPLTALHTMMDLERVMNFPRGEVACR